MLLVGCDAWQSLERRLHCSRDLRTSEKQTFVFTSTDIFTGMGRLKTDRLSYLLFLECSGFKETDVTRIAWLYQAHRCTI